MRAPALSPVVLEGRHVRTLIDRTLAAGESTARWDGRYETGRVATPAFPTVAAPRPRQLPWIAVDAVTLLASCLHSTGRSLFASVAVSRASCPMLALVAVVAASAVA